MSIVWTEQSISRSKTIQTELLKSSGRHGRVMCFSFNFARHGGPGIHYGWLRDAPRAVSRAPGPSARGAAGAAPAPLWPAAPTGVSARNRRNCSKIVRNAVAYPGLSEKKGPQKIKLAMVCGPATGKAMGSVESLLTAARSSLGRSSDSLNADLRSPRGLQSPGQINVLSALPPSGPRPLR